MPTLRVIHADIHSSGTLKSLLNGADVAINLVGILNEAGRDGAGFHHAHVELTRKLIAACGANRVRRLVQVSALNASSPDMREDDTSYYLRSKGEAEALLRASTLRWTILQPSVIFGAGDSFLNRFAGLLRALPLALPLAMPKARFAPVHVDDVVEAIARVLHEPATASHTYQLYGPDIFTLRELVEMVAEALALRRRVIGLPRFVSRLQAAIMDFVPGKPFSTDNFRSLLTDSVGSDDGLRELGITPRPLRPNLADALGGAGLTGIRDNYRKRARR
jgi:NADH dehydrogenase